MYAFNQMREDSQNSRKQGERGVTWKERFESGPLAQRLMERDPEPSGYMRANDASLKITEVKQPKKKKSVRRC